MDRRYASGRRIHTARRSRVQGIVVESVNVRVLLYAPVLSAWVGPMC